QGDGGQDTGPGPPHRRRVRRRRGGAVEHRVIRHRAAEARLGTARVWHGEGADLRGAARQAARRTAVRVAGGGRVVWRRRGVRVGGGHRGRRVAGAGAVLQADAEGRRQGEDGQVTDP